MIKQISAIILSLGLSANAIAAEKTNATLKKISQKYRSAKLVEMNVEKTLKSDLTGKETKFDGTIALGGGKFRWENKTPEETLLVFDGKTIWKVQYPPKEFGGDPQIAKGKIDKKNKSQTILASLLSGDLQASFKVNDEKKDGDISTLSIAPKKKDETQILDIKIVVDLKKTEITQVSYSDEIKNLTTIKFSDIKFKDSVKKNLFKYEPPKGVPVTDL